MLRIRFNSVLFSLLIHFKGNRPRVFLILKTLELMRKYIFKVTFQFYFFPKYVNGNFRLLMNTMPSQVCLGTKSLKMPSSCKHLRKQISSQVKGNVPKGCCDFLKFLVSSVLLSDSFPLVIWNYTPRERGWQFSSLSVLPNR